MLHITYQWLVCIPNQAYATFSGPSIAYAIIFLIVTETFRVPCFLWNRKNK